MSKKWERVMEEAATEPPKKKRRTKPKQEPEGIGHAEPVAELAEADEQLNEYKDTVLRLKAEIDNLHRRAEKDVASAHKFGLKNIVSELLPVLDSLEHGLASSHGKAEDELYKNIQHGIVLTRDMFLKALQKFKVEQLDPMGEMFNPEFHEAMSTQPDSKVKPNTVLQVLQKGYTLNGRLIRPALVLVSKKS